MKIPPGPIRPKLQYAKISLLFENANSSNVNSIYMINYAMECELLALILCQMNTSLLQHLKKVCIQA